MLGIWHGLGIEDNGGGWELEGWAGCDVVILWTTGLGRSG